MKKFKEICSVLLAILCLNGIWGSDTYFETFYENPFDPFNRNAVKIDKFKWPNGRILYQFDETYCEYLHVKSSERVLTVSEFHYELAEMSI